MPSQYRNPQNISISQEDWLQEVTRVGIAVYQACYQKEGYIFYLRYVGSPPERMWRVQVFRSSLTGGYYWQEEWYIPNCAWGSAIIETCHRIEAYPTTQQLTVPDLYFQTAPSTPSLVVATVETTYTCPLCKSDMALIEGKFGKFWCCTSWKKTQCPATLGIDGQPSKKTKVLMLKRGLGKIKIVGEKEPTSIGSDRLDAVDLT